MFRRLLRTPDDPALTIMRLILGVVFFAHGAQKVLGWFGGPGLRGAMDGLTQHLGLPAPLAVLVIAAEFLGGIALILGFLGRIAALGILANMVGAIFMVHAKFGFFMNWFGGQKGEGFEYHLLAIGLACAILLDGSGALSLDHFLTRDHAPPEPLQKTASA